MAARRQIELRAAYKVYLPLYDDSRRSILSDLDAAPIEPSSSGRCDSRGRIRLRGAGFYCSPYRQPRQSASSLRFIFGKAPALYGSTSRALASIRHRNPWEQLACAITSPFRQGGRPIQLPRRLLPAWPRRQQNAQLLLQPQLRQTDGSSQAHHRELAHETLVEARRHKGDRAFWPWPSR